MYLVVTGCLCWLLSNNISDFRRKKETSCSLAQPRRLNEHHTHTDTNVHNFSKISMFNTHSFRNKFSDLEALAESENVHIIDVSES